MSAAAVVRSTQELTTLRHVSKLKKYYIDSLPPILVEFFSIDMMFTFSLLCTASYQKSIGWSHTSYFTNRILQEFDKIGPEMKALLKQNNIIVSGSFLLNVLLGEQKKWSPGDIDIYMIVDDKTAVQKTPLERWLDLNSERSFSNEAWGDYIPALDSRRLHSVDTWTINKSCQVQVIRCSKERYATFEDIVLDFDFLFCANYLHLAPNKKKTLMVLNKHSLRHRASPHSFPHLPASRTHSGLLKNSIFEKWVQEMESKEFQFNSFLSRIPKVSFLSKYALSKMENRWKKYQKRGFVIVDKASELESDLVTPTKKNSDDYHLDRIRFYEGCELRKSPQYFAFFPGAFSKQTLDREKLKFRIRDEFQI